MDTLGPVDAPEVVAFSNWAKIIASNSDQLTKEQATADLLLEFPQLDQAVSRYSDTAYTRLSYTLTALQRHSKDLPLEWKLANWIESDSTFAADFDRLCQAFHGLTAYDPDIGLRFDCSSLQIGLWSIKAREFAIALKAASTRKAFPISANEIEQAADLILATTIGVCAITDELLSAKRAIVALWLKLSDREVATEGAQSVSTPIQDSLSAHNNSIGSIASNEVQVTPNLKLSIDLVNRNIKRHQSNYFGIVRDFDNFQGDLWKAIRAFVDADGEPVDLSKLLPMQSHSNLRNTVKTINGELSPIDLKAVSVGKLTWKLVDSPP